MPIIVASKAYYNGYTGASLHSYYNGLKGASVKVRKCTANQIGL